MVQAFATNVEIRKCRPGHFLHLLEAFGGMKRMGKNEECEAGGRYPDFTGAVKEFRPWIGTGRKEARLKLPGVAGRRIAIFREFLRRCRGR